MEISKNEFGVYQGQTVLQYNLINDHGMRLSVMNYGATLNRIEVPDRHGERASIVLGYDQFDHYLNQDAYFGATVGRVAGRIAKGSFSIDGHDYQLPLNNGENTNHGGPQSFESQIWNSWVFINDDHIGVKFDLLSPDGTNGFPGNLKATVTYSLNNENQWRLHYEATTDKPTLFNPTNHVYFNLSGDFTKKIEDHILTINSHQFGEIRQDGLPTGELIDVHGTPFDFTHGAPIKKGIYSDYPQNKLVDGYDHPFLLDMNEKPSAVLEDPTSGRRVTMTTTNNAVVVYTGNGFSSDMTMVGKPMQPHQGVTLEAQMMPDAIHHQGFGNIILRPGKKYQADTVYHFDDANDIQCK
ncbi:galactose mutarotase [Sporolactobacillus shoreicorticis]|uniref:Aldose 1-epimerase n=1 Tax=Sporolactobacillus shoreicorticis TaxID=1923877 RepID=A0ABW5S0N5_9BACL|nr:aldose epimerase family protein [Sporolactobacillus shoreicorticis]MCO7124648.1 galactose mutarotase [Sporolactobacillus shoreicorticis]